MAEPTTDRTGHGMAGKPEAQEKRPPLSANGPPTPEGEGGNDDKVISNALAEALNALGQDTGGAIAALKRRSMQTRRMLRWVTADATRPMT